MMGPGLAAGALKRSRLALTDLESQLGDLLVQLRSPEPHIDSAAPQRLARAKAEASAAMARLQAIGSLF
jgi:hypothetical protein